MKAWPIFSSIFETLPFGQRSKKTTEKIENCTHLYEKYIGKCDLFNSVHFNSVLTIRRFVICFLYVAYFRCRCVRVRVCVFFLLLATNSCSEKQLHKNVVFRFDDNSYTLDIKYSTERIQTEKSCLFYLNEHLYAHVASLKPKICWQNRIYFYTWMKIWLLV